MNFSMVVQMLKRCKIRADFTEKLLKQDSTIIEVDESPLNTSSNFRRWCHVSLVDVNKCSPWLWSKPRVDLLNYLKNMAVCLEWDKQVFNFQKHIFGKSFHTTRFQAILLWRNKKKWFYTMWNIGQICFECLMFMNFVALIYCVKQCTASFPKLPCLV
jgi:hypothetical protein